MFGIKKSLIASSEKSKNDYSTDKDFSNSHSVDDSKFIYYANTEEFISKFEIYVKPNNYPNKKILIVIKTEVDFKELNSQIKESFKSISEFKNIAGLRIENLQKIQNESRINLPKNGCINEYLKSGDIIYCDIISDEFWIKTYFKITTYNYRKVVKLEYKFHKKTKLRQVKLILLKAGIELFLEDLKKQILDNSYNYFVKEVKFNNNKRKKSQTGYEMDNFRKKLKYLDNKNEILVNLKFGFFEELVHEQLISMNLNKNSYNYLRLNEYCNLLFEELLTSKKFQMELATVQEISRDFLTSQNNDLNTPFLFYNIKKKETVDEYMYNIINLSNSIEPEIEDEEEDDEFDFEGETSFGKFYSDNPSKYFGDITLIKKTKNNYIRKHNKFDTNMIIISPFLFKQSAIDNKKANDLNSKDDKVFRTFAHKNINENSGRKQNEIDNFFVGPLSLDTNNNILKNDQNNLFYNDNDNELFLNVGNNQNVNNKNGEEDLKNVFFLDEQSERNKDRYSVKLDDAISYKSKRSIFSIMRLSKQSNCCNELTNSFSQVEFIQNLKKKYKNYISKKIMEKIVIPESKDYENVDKDFLIFLKKKENEEDNSLIVKNKKLIIFLCIFFIYYLAMIFIINYEIINLFI